MHLKLSIFFFILLANVPAQAALITVNTHSIVEDFSSFSWPDLNFSAIYEPIQLNGGATLSTNISNPYSAGSLIGNGTYGFGDNGRWDSNRNGYVAINNTFLPIITINFNVLQSYVGGFMNHEPTGSPIIFSAYDSSGTLLEQYAQSLSYSGSDYNSGHFFGIERTVVDISYVTISANIMGFDNLTFDHLLPHEPLTPFEPYYPSGRPPTIPIPPAFLLFGSGLLGLMGVSRKKKTQIASA